MSSPMLSPFAALNQARNTVLGFPKRFVLATLLGALTFSTAAAEMPLTLADAQRRAVERSRQLSAQDHAITASRELAVAAGQLPDPVLQVGVNNLPVEGADRFSLSAEAMTMRSVGVMQTFTRADKRQLRAERFEREAEKSFTEKNTLIAAIERDTALAWLERYYAEAMAAVIAEHGDQAGLEIQAAEGAYRAGRGNQTDVFAARSALAAFEDRASEIQRRIRNAKVMLARWTGAAEDMPLAGKPAIDAIRLDTAALDTQLAHHPHIAVMAKQEEIAAIEARLAQAGKKSDWSVELMFSQRGPAYSNMISVGVSIPLQWNQKNRQDRELASKLAMAEQAKAEREELLRAYIAETRATINEWQNGRERLARYERELIPLAKERTLAAIAAYRGANASLADVLAARRNEIEVRMQSLQLETGTARLWAQLNFLFPVESLASHSAMDRGMK